MGYDLHITRAVEWFDPAGPHISVVEWHAFVAADPELVLDPTGGPNFVIWRESSTRREEWLDWSEPGCIFTKNPNRALVAKMLDIAARLGARVQGDEGEVYTDPLQIREHDGFIPSKAVPRRSWWQRLFYS